jgi:hypothetical protein
MEVHLSKVGIRPISDFRGSLGFQAGRGGGVLQGFSPKMRSAPADCTVAEEAKRFRHLELQGVLQGIMGVLRGAVGVFGSL